MPLKNKVLYRSILASLFLHGVSLFVFGHYCLWLKQPRTPENKIAWASSIGKTEKDLILKEAFQITESSTESSSEIPHPSPQPLSSLSTPKLEPLPFTQKEPPLPSSSSFSPSLLSTEKPLAFSLPLNQTFPLFEHLPKDLILSALPAPAPSSPPPLPSLQATPSQPLAVTPLSFQDQEAPASPPPSASLPSAQIPLVETTPLATPPCFPPHLPQLPTLKELETASYSEAFDTEILFLEQEDETYLFALTLIPRPDLELPKIRQHYTFLIDRSNSIQKERLYAEKMAIKRALSELDKEDTFNIIAFDSKIEKLSPTALSPSKHSLAKAKEFLDKLQLGSFFSPADLYKPLFLTTPSTINDDELYTAILLTDGENLTKKTSQYALLRDWTAYNQGKVTLFGIGMNGDFSMETLDAVTAFNRGKLFYSPTHRGIKRKLLKLMKTIHTPVAKNITCRAISLSPTSKIEIFSKTRPSPHLYLNEPYIILGSTHSLDDFVIFVQGRLKDRWLNIKKTVTFLNAKKGGSSLKTEGALQKAYQLYEKYLLDSDPEHLVQVRSLLEPYNLRSAF